MKAHTIPGLVPLITATLLACQSSSGASNGIHYQPPTTEFRDQLNLTPPITEDDAKAIAAQAAGGTALSVTQEQEDGQLLYEVKVQTSAGRKEVEVQASDGAVVEIEPDDND